MSMSTKKMMYMIRDQILSKIEEYYRHEDAAISHHRTMCDEHLTIGSFNVCCNSIKPEGISDPRIKRVLKYYIDEHEQKCHKYIDILGDVIKVHDDLCDCKGNKAVENSRLEHAKMNQTGAPKQVKRKCGRPTRREEQVGN